MSKSKRGFASMDPAKQHKISSMGGLAVPAGKRAFSKDRQLAVKAGHKGGVSVPPEKRSYSVNRRLASIAGRKGGLAGGKGRPKTASAVPQDSQPLLPLEPKP